MIRPPLRDWPRRPAPRWLERRVASKLAPTTAGMIDSPHNPRVKRFRALAQRKYRREEGCFPIEGTHLLEEALAAHATLEEVFVCPERATSENAQRLVAAVRAAGVPCQEVTERAFQQLSDTETPQGLAAIARLPETRLEQLILPPTALVLVACEINDPGNLGTMIRTASAAGAEAVVCTAGSVDAFGPKVVRSTQGTIFHLPVVQDVTASELVTWARAQAVALVATSTQAEQAYFAASYADRTAVLVGSEAHGLSEELLAAADRHVRIPMPGRAESLNAAIAAALMLFEVVRQRSIETQR